MVARLIAWVVSPSNLVFFLGFLGLALLWTRFASGGKRLLVVSYLLIAILGMSPLANALLLPLEERFPPYDPARGAPHGIIVLGGSIDAELSVARGQIVLADAAERLTIVAELAQRYPTAMIVLSGGSDRALPAEAELAARLLNTFGIVPERVVTETRSLNTAENARFSKQLLDPKPTERWLLVTSAVHMPRAIGTFRKAGFHVDAYPVDWQTRGRRDLLSPFSSPLRGLSLCDAAMHEWLGLLIYWLKGQTAAFFPAP